MKIFTSFPSRKLFISVIFLLFTGFGLLAQTVRTDKLDYLPGETAYASGSGWVENSTLTFTMHEETVYLQESPFNYHNTYNNLNHIQ